MVANIPPKIAFQYTLSPLTGKEIRVFASAELARRHIEDHMLTTPEATAWSLAAHGYAELVNCSRPNELYLAARGLVLPERLQALYDVYASLIDRALSEARVLGWAVQAGGAVIAMGLSGLVVVIEGDVVKTAFFPGFGRPSEVLAAAPTSRPNGLLRRQQRASERQLIGRGRRSLAMRRHEARMIQWSDDERRFHQVFDPALRRVRSWTDSLVPFGPGGRSYVACYSRLKKVLPMRGRLRYEQWIQLRFICDVCISQGLHLS